MSPAPLLAATCAGLGPGRAGWSREDAGSERDGSGCSRASGRGAALTTIGLLGGEVRVVVLVICCGFLGRHDRILQRDGALPSCRQGVQLLETRGDCENRPQVARAVTHPCARHTDRRFAALKSHVTPQAGAHSAPQAVTFPAGATKRAFSHHACLGPSPSHRTCGPQPGGILSPPPGSGVTADVIMQAAPSWWPPGPQCGCPSA